MCRKHRIWSRIFIVSAVAVALVLSAGVAVLLYAAPAQAAGTGTVAVAVTDSTGANVVLGGDQAWIQINGGSIAYVGAVGTSGFRESTAPAGASVEVWVAKNGTYSQHQKGVVPDGGTIRFDFYTTKVTLQYSGDLAFGGPNGDSAWFAKPYMELLSDGTNPVHFRLDGTGTVSGRTALLWPVATGTGATYTRSLVAVRLVDSANVGLAGGQASAYVAGWKQLGTTETTGVVVGAFDGLLSNVTFSMGYVGATIQKSQNVAAASVVKFQTAKVTMELLDSTSTHLAGGAQYYASGWKTFGGGTTTASMELLPTTYTFAVTYGGATIQKSQNIASDPAVVFNTKLVTMELLDSTSTHLAGGAQYYASGWKTFGGGTTTASMELLPTTYTFAVTYGGATIQKSQNVANDPLVIFTGTEVTIQFSGTIQYYAAGWKTFTKPTMTLLPGAYTFSFSGNGYPAVNVTLNVTGDEVKKSVVYVRLLSSTNSPLAGGVASAYVNGWQTIGTTNSSGAVVGLFDGLLGNTSATTTYNGTSQQITQYQPTNSIYTFQTGSVVSDGGTATGYYAGGWKTFSQYVQLLPGTYLFSFSDGTSNTGYAITAGTLNHIH